MPPRIGEHSVQSGRRPGGRWFGDIHHCFAGAVLQTQVSDLLAQQYAATKGITVSSADLATAKSDFEATLDGEINSTGGDGRVRRHHSPTARKPAAPPSAAPSCWPGSPPIVAAAQVQNQAIDEKLLALGADLSNSAVLKYYNSNLSQFTQACVSRIVTAK